MNIAISHRQHNFSLFHSSNAQPVHRPLRDLKAGGQYRLPSQESATSTNQRLAKISASHADDVDLNHSSTNTVFRRARKHGIHRKLRIATRPYEKIEDQYKTLGDETDSTKSLSKASTNYDFAVLKKELAAILNLEDFGHLHASKDRTIPGTFASSNDDQNTTFFEGNLSEFDPEVIFRICVASKDSSLAVQTFMSECDEVSLDSFVAKIQPYLQEMVSHRFGNFVVQRLISKHLPTLKAVEKLARQNFQTLITNEFSSRVLEVVIQLSQSACDFALEYFRANFNEAILSNSACLILVAGIKQTPHFGKCAFIVERLREQRRILGNKFFRRALVTFLTVSPKEYLDQVASIMDVSSQFTQLFSRKATASVAVSLLQRDHAETWNALTRQLRRAPARLLARPLFVQSLARAVSLNQSGYSREVTGILTSLAAKDAATLTASATIFGHFVFAVLLCAADCQATAVDRFLERPDIAAPLARLLEKQDWNCAEDNSS